MIITACFVLGCTSGPGLSRVLKDTPNAIVKLDISQPGESQEFDHPAKVSQAHLQDFFESFTTRSSATVLANIFGNKKTAPPHAFSKEFIHTLVPPIAEGLGRATSLEEVVFYFQESSNHSLQQITSGSIYIKGGKLHLVVANFKYSTAKPYDMRRIREEPRLVLAEPYQEIVPGTNITLTESPTLEHLLSLKPQHFIVDQQILGSSSPKSILPKTSSPTGELKNRHNAEERFRQIKTLLEQGFISEEEYQTKRQEILDGL